MKPLTAKKAMTLTDLAVAQHAASDERYLDSAHRLDAGRAFAALGFTSIEAYVAAEWPFSSRTFRTAARAGETRARLRAAGLRIPAGIGASVWATPDAGDITQIVQAVKAGMPLREALTARIAESMATYVEDELVETLALDAPIGLLALNSAIEVLAFATPVSQLTEFEAALVDALDALTRIVEVVHAIAQREAK